MVVGSALASDISSSSAIEILECQRLLHHLLCHIILHLAGEYDLAAVHASLRSYIYKYIGGTHNFLIVLDYDYGVSYVSQSLENRDKSLCITRMKSDARLIKNIEGTN